MVDCDRSIVGRELHIVDPCDGHICQFAWFYEAAFGDSLCCSLMISKGLDRCCEKVATYSSTVLSEEDSYPLDRE